MNTPDGSIALSFGALQTAESQLASNLSTLRARLEQLETELQPLVHTWTGDAQAAYLIQKKQWEQAADDLAIMLSRHRDRSQHHQYRLRRRTAQDRRGLQLTTRPVVRRSLRRNDLPGSRRTLVAAFRCG